MVVAALESGALDDGTAVDTWLLAAADGDPEVNSAFSGAAELADGEVVSLEGAIVTPGAAAQLVAGGGAGADAGQTGPKIDVQRCNIFCHWNNHMNNIIYTNKQGRIQEHFRKGS